MTGIKVWQIDASYKTLLKVMAKIDAST